MYISKIAIRNYRNFLNAKFNFDELVKSLGKKNENKDWKL